MLRRGTNNLMRKGHNPRPIACEDFVHMLCHRDHMDMQQTKERQQKYSLEFFF